MKIISTILIAICLVFTDSGIQQDMSKQASLIIKITDLHSQKGQVGISLYNTKEGFPREESAIFSQIFLSGWKGTMADTVLTGLPIGDYAIAAFHDENSDCDMNYAFFYIPTEGYCFSNNVKPTLRAPKWEEAKFTFSGEIVIQEIEMKY